MTTVAENPRWAPAVRRPAHDDAGTPALSGPTLLGVLGTTVLAVASDLPGSPYGPHAGGLWPFAAGGPAPGWEGPKVPSWAMVADQGPGVTPGRLLPTLAVVVGVALLGLAWVLLWRRTRHRPAGRVRRVWWVVAAWVAPLLFAAPFASQDVWTYGAEGKMVVDGFGGYRPVTMLGHSVWTSGVDGKWLVHPSPYGPGELDLSAFFVKISGGHPWVAAECWRLAAILGLVLCAGAVTRIVGSTDHHPTGAAVAAVANPAMLIVLVAGIHNDALMLGLTLAAVSLALSGRRGLGHAALRRRRGRETQRPPGGGGAGLVGLGEPWARPDRGGAGRCASPWPPFWW